MSTICQCPLCPMKIFDLSQRIWMKMGLHIALREGISVETSQHRFSHTYHLVIWSFTGLLYNCLAWSVSNVVFLYIRTDTTTGDKEYNRTIFMQNRIEFSIAIGCSIQRLNGEVWMMKLSCKIAIDPNKKVPMDANLLYQHSAPYRSAEVTVARITK